jgi:hypothetical protein
VTSQKISGPEHAISRLFIVSRVHERLREVVTHSFKHSLQSAFESNDIAAVVTVVPRDSPADGQFDRALEEHAADTLMLIDLDPLIRTRPDGYEAVVGTRFTATARQPRDWDPLWRATGKVDYITMFGPRYTAHAGIRKEFAWHTTAAIVRSFVRDMTGRPSAPVYTVTEDRQANGQRID